MATETTKTDKPKSLSPTIGLAPETARRLREVASEAGLSHTKLVELMLDTFERHRRRNGK